MTHLDQRAKRVEAAVNAPPIHKIYANSAVSIHAQQRGSALYPYRLMQDALDSIPAGTSEDNADDYKQYVVKLEPGLIYDEAPNVDLNRKNVRLISDAAWYLGNPDQSNRRNLTVKTYDNAVNFFQPHFSLGYDNGMLPSADGAQISGKVSIEGGIPAMVFHAHADIKGTTGDATGESIECDNYTGSNIFTSLYSTALRGKWTSVGTGAGGPGFRAVRADRTLFYGTLKLVSIDNFWECDFRDDVEIGLVSGSQMRGLVNCKFPGGAITWTGPANSFVVDGMTNKHAKAAPVSFGGAASKVLNFDNVA